MPDEKDQPESAPLRPECLAMIHTLSASHAHNIDASASSDTSTQTAAVVYTAFVRLPVLTRGRCESVATTPHTLAAELDTHVGSKSQLVSLDPE